MPADHVLAIDIGGSKIAAALVSRTGEVTRPSQIATNAKEGGEKVMERVIGHALLYLDNAPAAIGVGSAGQIDVEQGSVKFATEIMPGWTGIPIAARLHHATGLPVWVENDVNAFALGEGSYGAARSCMHALCIMVGTGIGGALILNGQLFRGTSGSAGEFGHINIERNGRQCTCGGIGCVEQYASGPAIAADWVRRVGVRTAVQLGVDAHTPRLEPVAQAAHAGQHEARAAIVYGGASLGIAVVDALHLVNPEVVVIGGGVLDMEGEMAQVYLDAARSSIQMRAMPSYRQTRVLPATLGVHAVLTGAAVQAWYMLGQSQSGSVR